ncbi:hypothetical protein CEXT_776951 [Caerostris extrusa]|uniref:Uncharacterized protein n=1 Tax=Caerostris extrusa TaxID=172846 RepID=A0AAV4SNK5_CAEEX|nr:hypothetical protein CEXT_776951 [Caerostris extrusa]
MDSRPPAIRRTRARPRWMPSTPANSRSRLQVHKSAHRWRWTLHSGAKSRGFNIRMGLMGREAIMSCSEQDSICCENCYGVSSVADMRNLVNVSVNVFVSKEGPLTVSILSPYLNERN